MDHLLTREQLIRHEGLKLLPYVDSVGKLTIGVGRNLTDRGLSYDEALILLSNDIIIAERNARTLCPTYANLSDARQQVLTNMSFNLGWSRLSKFVKMFAAIAAGDFALAAKEMLDSKWAKQVGGRADELAKMMKEG